MGKNLKTCQGCHRELPLSMFPRRKDTCFHCTFNGPGVKEDVLNLEERNTPEINEELIYVKHEQELITILKDHPEGLSTKELSQYLGITRDATYKVCNDLEKMNKVIVRKEQRGAGKAQNIYTLPPLSSIMPERLEAPELQDTLNELQQTSTNTSIEDKEFLLVKKWTELKNRLIMDGDCGTALKIMVEMEEEAHP